LKARKSKGTLEGKKKGQDKGLVHKAPASRKGTKRIKTGGKNLLDNGQVDGQNPTQTTTIWGAKKKKPLTKAGRDCGTKN